MNDIELIAICDKALNALRQPSLLGLYECLKAIELQCKRQNIMSPVEPCEVVHPEHRCSWLRNCHGRYQQVGWRTMAVMCGDKAMPLIDRKSCEELKSAIRDLKEQVESACDVVASGAPSATMAATGDRGNGVESKSKPAEAVVIDWDAIQKQAAKAKSVDWLPAKKIAGRKSENISTRSLRDYRLASKGGHQLPDGTLGIDKDGRIWRRGNTPKSHVLYLRQTLLGTLRKAE